MKWIARQLRMAFRLAVVTATLVGIIVALDAVLSPDGDPRRAARARD